MDTAKVEIGKLQLLCDRINSMVEALNQVRLSVHGLQSSSIPTASAPAPWTSFTGPTPWGVYPTGIAHSSPWWTWQAFQPAWGTTPYFTRTPYPAPGVPLHGGFARGTGETFIDPWLFARIATNFPFAFSGPGNTNGNVVNGQIPIG